MGLSDKNVMAHPLRAI